MMWDDPVVLRSSLLFHLREHMPVPVSFRRYGKRSYRHRTPGPFVVVWVTCETCSYRTSDEWLPSWWYMQNDATRWATALLECPECGNRCTILQGHRKGAA